MLQEYLHKHPLTRHIYGREAVEKIRRHAFLAGNPAAKMSRSQKQNAYYWGVVLKTIGDDTGYLPEEMHQLMTREFLSYEKEPGEVFVFVALPNETEFAYDPPKVKK